MKNLRLTRAILKRGLTFDDAGGPQGPQGPQGLQGPQVRKVLKVRKVRKIRKIRRLATALRGVFNLESPLPKTYTGHHTHGRAQE